MPARSYSVPIAVGLGRAHIQPMLSALLSSFIVVMSTGTMEWPSWALEAHERGHIACPQWKHPEIAKRLSDLVPPKECRYKGKITIVRFSPAKTRRICSGSAACLVDPSFTMKEFLAAVDHQP